MHVHFDPPQDTLADARHHAEAAAGNAQTAAEASGVLLNALSGESDIQRILLKAAAGAGKSYVLKKLVADAVNHPRCERVAVIAFQNRQLWPLAADLGAVLGRDQVCLFVSAKRYDDVPEDVHESAVVVTTTSAIPDDIRVVVSTSHKLGAIGELNRMQSHFGVGANGEQVFDALFVDEAWQLPHHLFDKVTRAAPIVVGVGDVGQLPPLEIGTNPWRGDPGYNPYRAWPTEHEGKEGTWAAELPAVWRPTAEQLPLWRAFYPEWGELNSVARPGDRHVDTRAINGLPGAVWTQVGTGTPTLLEVDGLPDPEAPDVDLPLIRFVEQLVDELFQAGFVCVQQKYDDSGTPIDQVVEARPQDEDGDPLVVILATRNQAVDDATELCERVRDKHELTERDLTASTVDSWQGQTNRITVAIHPLTGASRLDEFNSAFGRLAVTCTRATHGLLIVSRPGLDTLLAEAPARAGTPFGEPGNRHLPRQTHQRILATFARGTVNVTNDDNEGAG